VRGNQGSVNVRLAPSSTSALVALIPATPTIIKMIDGVQLRASERVQETINNQAGVWLPVMAGFNIGWAFSAYLDVQPVIVAPPPVIVEPPAPQVVKWQVVIDYEGSPEQLEASRQAWTGMNTFLRQQIVANVQPVQAIQIKNVP
jgi:hypothetical protein